MPSGSDLILIFGLRSDSTLSSCPFLKMLSTFSSVLPQFMLDNSSLYKRDESNSRECACLCSQFRTFESFFFQVCFRIFSCFLFLCATAQVKVNFFCLQEEDFFLFFKMSDGSFLGMPFLTWSSLVGWVCELTPLAFSGKRKTSKMNST